MLYILVNRKTCLYLLSFKIALHLGWARYRIPQAVSLFPVHEKDYSKLALSAMLNKGVNLK
jgi:hypothetical protein